MFRKLFIRLFFLCILTSGVVVLALAVLGFMAYQQPGFYTDLRGQQFSEADQLAVETKFKLMEREVAFWTNASLTRQRMQQQAVDVALPGEAAADAKQQDLMQDVKTISITQDQINTLLASSKATRQGDWRNPRVRLGENCVEFAFEVVAPQLSLIFSAELKPSLMADGRLRLDLNSAHVGQLRLPVETVLEYLPIEPSYRDDKLEFNLKGTTPHVCVTLPTAKAKGPTVKSIACLEGELLVELLPPVLPAKPDAAAAEAIELTSLD